MEDNKTNLIPDEELSAIAGGAVGRPRQEFEIDAPVKVIPYKYKEGRVISCYWDESLDTWSYGLEYGRYYGTRWEYAESEPPIRRFQQSELTAGTVYDDSWKPAGRGNA